MIFPTLHRRPLPLFDSLTTCVVTAALLTAACGSSGEPRGGGERRGAGGGGNSTGGAAGDGGAAGSGGGEMSTGGTGGSAGSAGAGGSGGSAGSAGSAGSSGMGGVAAGGGTGGVGGSAGAPPCKYNGAECAVFDGNIGDLQFTNDLGSDLTLVLWHPDTGSVFQSFDVMAAGQLTTDFGIGDDWGVQVEGREVETVDRVATWTGTLWQLAATDLRADQPCKFNGNTCVVFDGDIGLLHLVNDTGTEATVSLWHPDTGSVFQSVSVPAGSDTTTDFGIGDDWGVELTSGNVRTLDRVADFVGNTWELNVTDFELP